MYDPKLGRFTQTDPLLGNRPGKHYSYANNNPLSGSDPSGLEVRFSGPTAFGEWDRANAGKYSNLSFQFNYRSKKLEVFSGADSANLTADEKALLWAIGSNESYSPEQDAGWASHIGADYTFNTDALHRANILGKQQWGEGFELRDLNEVEDYKYVMTATGKDLSGNEFFVRDTFHDLHGLYTALNGAAISRRQSMDFFGRRWMASLKHHEVDIVQGAIMGVASIPSKPLGLDIGGGTFPGGGRWVRTPAFWTSVNVDAAAGADLALDITTSRLPIASGTMPQVTFNHIPAGALTGNALRESVRVLQAGGSLSITTGEALTQGGAASVASQLESMGVRATVTRIPGGFSITGIKE